MNSAQTDSLVSPEPSAGSLRSRAMARLARLFRRTPATQKLLAGISERIGELLHFGQQTDRDFTSMATGLGEITSQFESMRQRADDLEAVLQDRDQDRALQSTHDLCKSAIELVHASLGTSHALHARMGEADATLLQAVAAREDFEKNFTMLRTLSMGIRIEAARVSGEFQGVFSQVAAAIQAIDEKIATSTSRAFDRMGALLSETTGDRAETRRDENGLYRRAKESIDLVQRDIDMLRRGLAPCTEALRRASELLEATSGPRQSILSALQFQDIVRQKLEHVATGFRDMQQHALDRVFLHRAAMLQQTHLSGAREEIVTAGDKATGGLETLLQIGGEIHDILQTVESSAVLAFGRCRMEEIAERELLHLAQIANTSAETNRRIAARVERIETVVRVFSVEVAAHQREVKLVALNAQIAAARLSAGGALEKLAEEASHVARRNADTTKRLTDHLQNTLDRLVHIKREADGFMEAMNRDKSVLESGAATVGEKLIRHRQRIQNQSQAVRTEFTGVQESTRALLTSTRFAALVGGCIEPAEALCRALAEATAASVNTATLSLSGARRFHEHLRRYTMEEERAAHQAVLGAGGALVQGLVACAAHASDSISEAAPAAIPEVSRLDVLWPAPDDSGTCPAVAACDGAGITTATLSAVSPRPETDQDLGDGIELF